MFAIPFLSTIFSATLATNCLVCLMLTEPLQPKQLHHLHTQLSLGQSCPRQKSLVPMREGSFQWHLTLCDPVDCGLLGFSVRGFLQARILECIGHALLEHYISYCPNHWLP